MRLIKKCARYLSFFNIIEIAKYIYTLCTFYICVRISEGYVCAYIKKAKCASQYITIIYIYWLILLLVIF